MKKKEDEGKGKRNDLNIKERTAADLRPFARQVPVPAEALIKWIKTTALQSHRGLSSHPLPVLIYLNLLPDLHCQIIKIPMTISALNRCKKLAARKLTNARTVVLYFEEKEVLWLLSCRME